MSFTLSYELKESGWACIHFHDGGFEHLANVSYLHDSLREMAEAARAIRRGASFCRMGFFDEPGELQWRLTSRGTHLDYELRWYEFYQSWGEVSEDCYRLLYEGRIRHQRFIGEVCKVLKNVLNTYGIQGYRNRWVQHEFPLELLQDLNRE